MSEDRIEIRDLLVRGLIGLHEWERRGKQDILISMTLFTDLRRCGASDNVADSVNYSAVVRKVHDFVESSQRFTVEALATDIARICLGFGGVQRVRVRVEKPSAERFVDGIGVEIERTAADLA
jgi:FolB domain-containing protein